jgi:hypothetical protein
MLGCRIKDAGSASRSPPLARESAGAFILISIRNIIIPIIEFKRPIPDD